MPTTSVHTSDWRLPEVPLPLTLGPQDLSAVLRPFDATSWAEVPLALQIQNPEGRTVLLRLHSSGASCRIPPLTPCLNSRSIPGSQAQRPIIAFGATAALAQIAHLPGTAPISMVPSSASATRRPRLGSDSRTLAVRKSCKMGTGWYSSRSLRFMPCGTVTGRASWCRALPHRVRRQRCPLAATRTW